LICAPAKIRELMKLEMSNLISVTPVGRDKGHNGEEETVDTGGKGQAFSPHEKVFIKTNFQDWRRGLKSDCANS